MSNEKALLYIDTDYDRELETVTWDNHPNEEDELKFRTPFWRDYARILHSPAFRRLKGKTQLFPGYDSDFFRCRLTHSLEVAEIGKSIANYLNYRLEEFYKENNYKYDTHNSLIDTDLVQLACIAHDLGHPPFGHQGEAALDKKMYNCGGFEGNAQTLRILSVLEKKEYSQPPENEKDNLDYTGFANDGEDLRKGLNLSYRSLASVLKYDNEIKYKRNKNPKLEKGYYREEKELVKRIKDNVAPNLNKDETFKTIECQIMDIADDIAYSVYDIEDSFKAGFADPLSFLTSIHSKEAIEGVVEEVKKTGNKKEKDHLKDCDTETVKDIILRLFLELDLPDDGSQSFIHVPFMSKLYARVGYLRNIISSTLVTKFIYSTNIEYNKDNPSLSRISINEETELEIEVLKRLTYQFQILSPKLKIVENNGQNIVSELFDILSNEAGWELLPNDIKAIVYKLHDANKSDKIQRVICDFIAGMTDQFAIEYYNRLVSSAAISIHKPIN